MNGSPTKTALVDVSGSHSQWSHLTTATIVLLVLLFLTKPLSFVAAAARPPQLSAARTCAVHDDLDHWRLQEPLTGHMAEPGLLVFWFGASLFHASAGFFTEQVRKLVDESPHTSTVAGH